MLHALEMGEVTSLREHYAEDAKDPTWIPDLGGNGWTLITVDHKQLRKPEERKLLQEAGIIAFYIVRPFIDLDFSEQAWRLVKMWPSITQKARTTRGGRCYLVRLNGAVDDYPVR
jgi:hypothetical protein